MIKGVFIINAAGKARLIKCYERLPEAVQQQLVREAFSVLSKRADTACNFAEAGGSLAALGKGTKLIYRCYATLYFVVAADASESELGILDLIQVFVEALDAVFADVCELDLIFHPARVHAVLDEMLQGGMVLETNLASILAAVSDADKLEAATAKSAVKA